MVEVVGDDRSDALPEGTDTVIQGAASSGESGTVTVEDTATVIEREIVVPSAPLKPASQRRLRRRGSPHDVVAAYMSALAELESHEGLARLPNETPAQHARRVRRHSGVDPEMAADFARLAAGYQLARYGERRGCAYQIHEVAQRGHQTWSPAPRAHRARRGSQRFIVAASPRSPPRQ